MNLFRKTWERIFPPIQPLAPGIYQYQSPADAATPLRLHLRIEPDGQSVLIVNASTVVHLNPTATEYVYHLIKETPEEQVITEMGKRYNIRREIVRRDYRDLKDRVSALVTTRDLDPVSDLGFNRQDPYLAPASAPYRLDCALTYRLDDGVGHYAPLERVSRELNQAEWETILDKAWNAGIPHVVFTGGEPTLRPDLFALVGHAETLGMVAGLITNGLRLSETKYLHQLLQSGLDHVMILLDSSDEQCWEAVRDTLQEDIALTVHLTLNQYELDHFDETLNHLVTLGAQSFSLSAASLEFKDALVEKRKEIADHHLHLVWDMPVPYSHFHPVAVELAEPDPDTDIVITGPGRAWIYVEPDGDVLPGQGHYQEVLGNMLTDAWETIWQHAQESSIITR
jgi:organic radical activating enzyme